ncbi:unnamed protein product [Fraxinus pennsylvanica]|uniref:Uncharacterized protein n=1 Tax=Fraxinus pennsylvanica TaxID=56036 RepID=A0AAD2E836_9LAMI|nr:unnamed protein product [Fraxinus pennsylvanica]
MATTDEIEEILKRFGNEESTLLDQYEMMSFKVQLKQAMLGRSLSEPRYQGQSNLMSKSVQQKRRWGWSRVWGIHKVLNKFLKPDKRATQDFLDSRGKYFVVNRSKI